MPQAVAIPVASKVAIAAFEAGYITSIGQAILLADMLGAIFGGIESYVASQLSSEIPPKPKAPSR